MLDALFEGIAWLLNFFYSGFGHNYAIAIALLTCAVMVITTPLTLKGTRSMIEMQRLQPEIRRLQAQYRDDRQKLNEEMMRFYREHEINPLGGCLPLLIQLPVFSILFWMIRGLINEADFVGLQRALTDYGITPRVTEGFSPKYLDHGSQMYQSLLSQDEMRSFGVDLALSPSAALGEGFLTALPHVLILVAIGGLAWYQQKQIMGRTAGVEVNPQQRMMMRIGPVLQVGFTFISPMALGIYFLVSTAWRVAQQTYITHSLYKGEDSVGRQAQRAMAEARSQRDKNKDKTQDRKPRSGGNGARPNRAARAVGKAATPKSATSNRRASGNGSTPKADRDQSSTSAASGATAGSGQAKPHPRSRKKKKRK
ncbi:MAG: YidC/Oxa1 family membrane protein insertase [Acidimicrobiales bacterium]